MATIIAGGLAYCIVTNGGPRFFNLGTPKRSDFGYFTEFPILIENSITITPDTAKILISPTSISSEALRYHIVAGCFTERINAERFLQNCLEKGFAAELLPGIGDMYPVSVDKSTSYEEAMAKRDEYNAQHSEKAWIYRTY